MGSSSRSRRQRPSVLALLWVSIAVLLTGGASPTSAACSSVPYLALPKTLGMDTCMGNNKANILVTLLSGSFKCSILDLVKLSQSESLTKMIAVLNQIVAAPEQISSTLYDMMLVTGDAEMDAFCRDWSQLLSPCMGALTPKLLKIIQADQECCGQLSDVVDMLNLVVPPTVSKDSFLLTDVVDGINEFMCASRLDTQQTCGASMFQQLRDTHSSSDFRVLESVLLPFFTASAGNECDAFQGKDYTSSASLSAAPRAIDYSCCVDHMRPLLTSVQTLFEFALGSTPFEFLNGIVEFSNPGAAFVNALEGAQGCSYAATCASPKGLIHYAKRDITPGTNQPKTNELHRTDCTRVRKCDARSEVCSTICEKGSVTVRPWLEYALTYQRELANSGPICFAQIPATHNTAINLADGFGNRDQLMNANLSPGKPSSFMKTNNQILSITDQLNIGVRWLEIDVHYFLDDIRTAHCGGLGSNSIDVLYSVIEEQLSKFGSILWGPELLGCFPSLSGIRAEEQPTTRSVMEEIRSWMDLPGNEDELVFVYMDTGDEMSRLDKYDDLNALVNETFGDLIVPITELATLRKNNWRGATLQDFVEDGHRAVLVANDNTGLAFRLKDFCDGHRILQMEHVDELPDENRMLGGLKIYSGDYFIRSYSADLRYISLNDAGVLSREQEVQIDRKNADKLVRWNENLVAPDSIDTSVMYAMVWSWAVNEPAVANGTVFTNAEGRWRSSDDVELALRACWNEDALEWTVVELEDKCPDGAVYAAPRDAYQNYLLQQTLLTEGITDSVAIDAVSGDEGFGGGPDDYDEHDGTGSRGTGASDGGSSGWWWVLWVAIAVGVVSAIFVSWRTFTRRQKREEPHHLPLHD